MHQEHRKIKISAGLQYVTHSSEPNIIGSRMQNDRPPPAAAHEKEQNFEGSVACACSPSYPRPCPGRAESRSPSSPLHSMSDTSSFTIPSHIITWAHYLTVFCHTTNLLAYSSLPYPYVPYIWSLHRATMWWITLPSPCLFCIQFQELLCFSAIACFKIAKPTKPT